MSCEREDKQLMFDSIEKGERVEGYKEWGDMVKVTSWEDAKLCLSRAERRMVAAIET